jgi:phage portal protein BeeE
LSRKRKKKKVKKAIYTRQNISPDNRHINYPILSGQNMKDKRGAVVYSLADIMGFSGYTQDGSMLTVSSDNPYFILSPQERNQIFQLSSPVLGIVSSRMNRIAGLEFEIVADSKIEDEKAEKLKDAYHIIKEFEGTTNLEYMVMVAKLRQYIMSNLNTVRPDLNNFDRALLRWKKEIQKTNQEKADDLKAWLMHPNPIESWIDFVKIWVYDLMVHGSDAIYKSTIDGKLNNIQHLAGGTTVPARTPFIDAQEAYIQVMDFRYQIFYEDEVVFSQYMPVSWRSYGMVPLEALINKVAEGLFFDRLMADRADGTKPPEKAVIVTEKKLFGADDDSAALDMGLPIAEQKRIEEKMNQPIKNGIITLNGNNIEVLDISKADTMEFQSKRQKDIREEVALVYNMSNIEINLTGSDDTSGRSTSEIQREIEQGKGVAPMLKTIEQKINSEILPYRGGPGYTFKFSVEDSEEKQIEKLTKKKNSGLWSVNQIRTEDLNEMPFEGEEFEKPSGSQTQNGELNPFFTKPLE